MYKNNKFSLAILIFCFSFMACQKEELDSQTVVKNHIVGSWPLKYEIRTTITNDTIVKIDTPTIFAPIDTLIFDIDGKVVKRNGDRIIFSTTYEIEPDGNGIKFGNNAGNLQTIAYVRQFSIGFVKTDTSYTEAGNKIKRNVVEQLKK